MYLRSETKVIDSYAKKIHNEINKINKKDDYDEATVSAASLL